MRSCRRPFYPGGFHPDRDIVIPVVLCFDELHFEIAALVAGDEFDLPADPAHQPIDVLLEEIIEEPVIEPEEYQLLSRLGRHAAYAASLASLAAFSIRMLRISLKGLLDTINLSFELSRER